MELTDEIRNSIREELLSDKESELYTATMNLWRDEADIVYTVAGEAFLTPPVEEETLATPTDLE